MWQQSLISEEVMDIIKKIQITGAHFKQIAQKLVDLQLRQLKLLMLSHKHIYFLCYSLVFVMYGAVVTGIGPIIIYFSQITGKDQTFYSFIFLARAIGYVAGGSLIKMFAKKYSLHNIFMVLIFVCGLSLIISSFSMSFINLAITMFISAACCCMMNVITNLCIFKLFIGDRQDYWVQLIHLVFGIGGLVGPMIVISYQHKGMLVIGIVFMLTMIPIWFLKSPENRQDARESVIAHKMSSKAELLVCVLFLFYIAEEVGLASWIPTYAYKANVANAEQAGILSSFFWITNTIFRIVLLYVPGTVEKRLKILTKGLFASTVFLVILQEFGYYTAVSYFGAFTQGMFLASMYALFLSITPERGFKMNSSNTANFMTSASLGEGLLIMPIGYAMGFFGFKSLIVIICILSGGMYLIFEILLKRFDQDMDEIKQDIHKEMLQTPKEKE